MRVIFKKTANHTTALSFGLSLLAALTLSACGGSDDNRISEINNDWTGNEIKVEALKDEKIEGIVCHMAHFDRSVIDRLRKGSWFENPSNGTIHCDATGPIVIGDIAMKPKGEDVFKQSQSLIFKTLSVRRIYDEQNNVIVYLVYSRQIIDGSAKMAIASVSLYGRDVTWLYPPNQADGTTLPTNPDTPETDTPETDTPD